MLWMTRIPMLLICKLTIGKNFDRYIGLKYLGEIISNHLFTVKIYPGEELQLYINNTLYRI